MTMTNDNSATGNNKKFYKFMPVKILIYSLQTLTHILSKGGVKIVYI